MKGRKVTDVFVSSELSVDGANGTVVATTTTTKPKKDSNHEATAQKLREKGFSYRRIAETLQVPYIMVSRWLNGDMRATVAANRSWAESDEEAEQAAMAGSSAAVVKLRPHRASAPAPEAPESSLGVDVLESQFKSFEKYVRGLMARFTTGQRESEEREQRLVALVEEQKADSVALRAEVKELRAIVDRLSRGLPAGAAAARAPAVVAAPAEDEDPFAETAAVEDDPFATADDPFASTEDPFAAAEDPFAETTAATDDPFAATDDPFAETAAEDPFATTEDPFAETAKATDDPFAETAATDDPFAETATSAEAAPFAEDPFAETPGGTGEEADPFAETPPKRGLLGKMTFWKK